MISSEKWKMGKKKLVEKGWKNGCISGRTIGKKVVEITNNKKKKSVEKTGKKWTEKLVEWKVEKRIQNRIKFGEIVIEKIS